MTAWSTLSYLYFLSFLDLFTFAWEQNSLIYAESCCSRSPSSRPTSVHPSEWLNSLTDASAMRCWSGALFRWVDPLVTQLCSILHLYLNDQNKSPSSALYGQCQWGAVTTRRQHWSRMISQIFLVNWNTFFLDQKNISFLSRTIAATQI